MTGSWGAHLPDGVAVEQIDLLPGGNLARAWLARWSADPDHPTVYDDRHGWLSAGGLEDQSRHIAGRLAGAGLVPGDRVVVSAQASVELVVAHVACLRSGLVVVPTNTAYRERELAHVVADAEPAAAIVDDAERGRWVATAVGERRCAV
ncbi:MAG: AMP-binding protein, partial [Acidimicrobiales bacterium]